MSKDRRKTLSHTEFIYRIKTRVIPDNEKLREAARLQEKRFLSSILLNPECLERAASSQGISYDYFWIRDHAVIFWIAASYFQDTNRLLSLDAFQNMIPQIGYPPNEAGALISLFQEILELRISADSYPVLVKGMVDRHIQASFWAKCSMGGNNLVMKLVESPADHRNLLSDLREQIDSIFSELAGDEYTAVRGFEEVIDGYADEFMERVKNPEIAYGLKTQFKSIDEELLGFRPGEYVIICAKPGGGKTTMMVNLAQQMAAEGAEVLYVTIELSSEELSERIMSKVTGIPTLELKKGGPQAADYEDDVRKAEAELKKDLGGGRFTWIDVPQGIPAGDLMNMIEQRRKRHNFKVLFVDYLDVVKAPVTYHDRPDLETGAVSQIIQGYGKRHGLVTVTAQSYNNEMIKTVKKILDKRELNTPDDWLTGLQDVLGTEGIGGTQKLARDADFIIGLWLKAQKDQLYCIWLKSRKSSGDRGFVLYSNLPACQLTEKTTEIAVDTTSMTFVLEELGRIAEKQRENALVDLDLRVSYADNEQRSRNRTAVIGQKIAKSNKKSDSGSFDEFDGEEEDSQNVLGDEKVDKEVKSASESNVKLGDTKW